MIIRKNSPSVSVNFIILSIIFLLFISAFSELKAQITPDGLYTTDTYTAGRHDIRAINPAVPVGGKSMIINRFTQFILPAGEEANIMLNGANTAVNIVGGGTGTVINGTLNARTGNVFTDPIGGNIIFIDPMGFMVSSTGIINVGSILLTSASQTYLPLTNGTSVNINDPAQLPQLLTQTIDPNGTVRFTVPTGPVVVAGIINSSPIDSIFNDISGVYMFGNNISISGSIDVNNDNADIGVFTGNSLDVNLASGDGQTTAPLASGGRIDISSSAVLQAPSGDMYFEVNTTDIANNVINIYGMLNANAISANSDGGNASLRTIQSGGSVLIDGGNIVASGLGTGSGGGLNVETSKFDIAFGAVSLMQGVSSNVGGRVVLTNNASSGPTIIGSGGFVTPATISRINLVDLFSNPDVYGQFAIIDNTGGGISLDDPVIFPIASDVMLSSSNGPVNINTGNTMWNQVYRDLNLSGTIINVNGWVETLGSDMLLQSSTGIINIGSDGRLKTATDGNILMTRSGDQGPLTVNSDGMIDAGGGTGVLVIGNYGEYNSTYGKIVLSGSSFGGLAGSYTSAQTFSSTSAPGITSKAILLYLTPAPPSPVDPDVHEEEEEARIEVESINSDLVNYESHWVDYNNTQKTIDELENPSDQDVVPETEEKLVQDVDLEIIIDVCNESSEACGDQVDDSVGSFMIDVLLEGYPYKNEFLADASGVEFSSQENYHPRGLESFLKKIKYLEDKFSTESNTEKAKNSLFNYKHPPAEERIERVVILIDKEHIQTKNTKINKRRFNKNVGKL